MKPALIILAGGKNRRFGSNKALATIGGTSLIERIVERLRPQTSQTLIVTAREQCSLPFINGAKVVADVYPEKGPLGGIYTGMLASRSLYNLVVACDMPFLNTGLLRYMVEQSDGFDVVVPRLEDGKLEPLHAIYSRACLDIIKTHLDWNDLRVDTIFDTVRVRYIEAEECRRYDPQLLSFFNINREVDLDRALSRATDGVLCVGTRE